MRILLHINQPERWNALESNLKNLIRAKRKTHSDLEIEVVVMGEAIQQLVDNSENSSLKSSLQNTVNAGVTIAGCHNSLNRFKIRKEEIFSFIKIVPAGIIEIAEKEEAGFAYVKP